MRHAVYVKELDYKALGVVYNCVCKRLVLMMWKFVFILLIFGLDIKILKKWSLQVTMRFYDLMVNNNL